MELSELARRVINLREIKKIIIENLQNAFRKRNFVAFKACFLYYIIDVAVWRQVGLVQPACTLPWYFLEVGAGVECLFRDRTVSCEANSVVEKCEKEICCWWRQLMSNVAGGAMCILMTTHRSSRKPICETCMVARLTSILVEENQIEINITIWRKIF